MLSSHSLPRHSELGIHELGIRELDIMLLSQKYFMQITSKIVNYYCIWYFRLHNYIKSFQDKH